MKKYALPYEIGVYSEGGHWLCSVSFYYKWQAILFHVLLNKSGRHQGTREFR